MMRMILGVIACTAGAAAAQSPLAGPKVVEAGAATPTLVQRGYDGGVTRLDVSPEEAALALLNLDDGAKESTQRVLGERAAILDKIVLDNLDLLIELHTAGEAGDKATVVRIGLDLMRKSEPLRARGLLRDELAKAMPAGRRDEFLRLVNEYWRAIGDEAKAKGKGRLGGVVEERGRLLGEAVKQSFERQVDRKGEEDFERLLARLELRPEQETRVRHMAEDFVVGAKFRPTRAQEAAFLVRVMAVLDQGQRRRLAQYLGEQGRAEMKK
jgi:hypothetical protein